LAEAEVIAKLSHPNIVQVYDFGVHQEQPFFALEYCAGGDLKARLAGVPLEARPAAELVAQLADAMEQAHTKGILHRDLKPQNILLSDPHASIPKITDFGLAKQTELSLTATGAVGMGTASYMPPEQADGLKLGPNRSRHARRAWWSGRQSGGAAMPWSARWPRRLCWH
jgi:serine/threonine protein kinase